MTIELFFNLQEKKVDNDVEIIIDEITKADIISNKTHKTDKKDMIVPKFEYFEAIQALQKFCLYEKQNDNGDNE